MKLAVFDHMESHFIRREAALPEPFYAKVTSDARLETAPYMHVHRFKFEVNFQQTIEATTPDLQMRERAMEEMGYHLYADIEHILQGIYYSLKADRPQRREVQELKNLLAMLRGADSRELPDPRPF